MVDTTTWNSRLAVSFTADGGSKTLVQPIDSFTPKIDTPHDVIDSIDKENIGYESKSRRFTFDFTARAVNTQIMRLMISTAFKQGSFEIIVEQQDPISDEWAFDNIAFKDCRFTSVSPSDLTNDGSAPTTSFSGMCLEINIANDTETIQPTHTVGADGDLTI